MTNAQIILGEQIRLQEEGILKYTGRMIEAVDMEGNEIEIPEIQPIHTYQAWKKLGYQVKKGEKCVAKFAVWKWLAKRQKTDDKKEEVDLADEVEGETLAKFKGRCYLKVSAFFTDEQVEKIKEGK